MRKTVARPTPEAAFARRGDQLGGREVAVLLGDQRGQRPTRLGHAVAGAVERVDDRGGVCHRRSLPQLRHSLIKLEMRPMEMGRPAHDVVTDGPRDRAAVRRCFAARRDATPSYPCIESREPTVSKATTTPQTRRARRAAEREAATPLDDDAASRPDGRRSS